ncbi:EutN/CcmL family microcompartment protein [Paramaledivibacter caminithermalis]|jgi:ethanolamine utilization protein EutN|uniref:Ethanolamine utilization protein EutN n=1 Tax=Paramaledivibacter caminithermalis (strain DSM 15212 / CIP 107654 / DViRD3) TaxID=1121301 RepID=A0A1M6P4L2_PARC5|nr:EutN/CcmL family microcompartment protein [Paramaledivibacter caminithermalis]SHK02842.1 ethanolamine utilization protein EutN [Paramaledivibacter caminithermalis DSM 15212]
MIVGKVVGNLVSTKKNSKMIGCKFMRIELTDNTYIIAVDQIGAGVGDEVIVTQGHNAIYAMNTDVPLPIDAVIIGIID